MDVFWHATYENERDQSDKLKENYDHVACANIPSAHTYVFATTAADPVTHAVTYFFTEFFVPVFRQGSTLRFV